jgi:hypothetical protein
LTRVLSLTIGSTISLQTIAVVAAGGVRTVTLNAGVGETFVDVYVAVVALESGSRAVTLIPIQEV